MACVLSNFDSRTPEGTGPRIVRTGKVGIRHRVERCVGGLLVNPVFQSLCRAKTIIEVRNRLEMAWWVVNRLHESLGHGGVCRSCPRTLE